MGKLNRRQFVGASATMLSAAGLHLPMWAQAVTGNAAGSAGPLLLGVDYYPDQTAESLWEEDARRFPKPVSRTYGSRSLPGH